MDIDLKQLRELMRYMKQLDVNELELELKGDRVFMRRGAVKSEAVPSTTTVVHAGGSSAVPAAGPVGGPGLAEAAMAEKRDVPVEAPVEDDGDAVFITCPFVGTFYSAASPDAAPFVEVGADIRPGTVLCIVEAMKLMNEIEAEVTGKVLDILVENGKPVEYGDKLFKIKPSR